MASGQSESQPIRSRRDFTRRFFPLRYHDEFVVSRPPSRCTQCSNFMNWRRSWGAWRCMGCGAFVWDEDRDV